MADHVAETPNRWIPSPEIRKYIYRVLVALGPVALLYGLLTDAEIAVWFGVAETILGSPIGALALVNTPAKAQTPTPTNVDPITGL